MASAATVPSASGLLSQVPLRFEENQGQWPGAVRFASRHGERSVSLLDGGEARIGALRLRPAGAAASAQARIEPLGKLAGGATYMLGRNRQAWRGNVASYRSVAYRGVYPGIDLLYKGTGRQLEYDFIVAAGADPGTIDFEFAGATSLTVDATGALVVATPEGEIRQPLPFAYQDAPGGVRTQVDARYRLLGAGRVGFAVGGYDAGRELVIDPVLVATYFGGDAMDIATAVAVDSQNQVWVAGYTSSTTLPMAGNPYYGERVGNSDVFVAKFNPNVSGQDSLVWSTYFGGDLEDKATAIVLSSDGFLYLTGSTMSSNFPLAGTPAQSALQGDTDAFLVRLSRTQQGIDALWYSTFFGGNLRDYGTAVTLDAQNQPYIAGYGTSGEGFTYAGGSFQPANRGGYDAFFARFQPDSTTPLSYSTFIGGTSTDVATGIAVDAQGLVHLTGYTMSNDFPATSGAYRTDYAGRGDIFYARADLTRSGLDGLLYATYIGGADADLAYAATADTAGNLYLTGYTFSSDFPLAGASLQATKAGSADSFVMKLNTAATQADQLIAYSTYLGGSGTDLAYGIALGAGNRLSITGYTDSSNFPTRGGPLQERTGGSIDAFLAMVDFSNAAAPSLLYSSYVGGDSPDIGYHVAPDSRGNLYMVGSTTSRRLGTDGVFQPDLSRYTDSFLVRFNLCENREACEAQGLLTPASAGGSKEGVSPLAAEACQEAGGPSLSLSGAVCAEAAAGGVLCTRKVCSADLQQQQ
ncbi:MAG: SBBP repeat-containing protein [Bryobacterales bacterium]|nr:SBBP repeat-containing protein [Bryobacterales bacterium]